MIQNRKARYEYEILQEYRAGMVLIGSEVKSIRNGDANINDAYCVVIDQEVFIRNMHIEHYKDSRFVHDVRRDRKLLLSKKEIKAITNMVVDKGITLIPLGVSTTTSNIKINIAVAKGKKLYDKRNSIKERDYKRSLQREHI